MRTKLFALIGASLFFISALSGQNFKNTMDSVSYSLGLLMAKNLMSQGLDTVDATSLAAGVQDVFAGNQLKIQPQEANQIINEYMTAKQASQFESVLAEGKAFLETNAQREEVTILPSGLQYEVLQAGIGAKPAASDQVTLHYTGTLIDATVFDSSIQRGEPATFGVNQVIPGWTEALQLMSEGAKWKLYIPYELAYGERGAGGVIQPYSTLIFEVELIKVN